MRTIPTVWRYDHDFHARSVRHGLSTLLFTSSCLMVLFIAASITWASDANADVLGRWGCPALAEIMRGAKDDFRTLEGSPKHEGLGMWHATVSFPGGHDCLVYAPPMRMYTCNLYTGDDESDADAAYREAAATVHRCLTKGWKVRQRVNGIRTLTEASSDRHSPSIFVVSAISDAAAHVVDVWVDLPIR